MKVSLEANLNLYPMQYVHAHASLYRMVNLFQLSPLFIKSVRAILYLIDGFHDFIPVLIQHTFSQLMFDHRAMHCLKHWQVFADFHM